MDKLDIRRVSFYLLFAFGFSWIVALILYLTGGLANSAPIQEGSPITWAVPLLIIFMLGPTIGNIAARLVTKEGLSNLWLRPKIRAGWPYWLAAWFLTPLFILAGAALYFALYPADLNGVISGAQPIPGIPPLDLPHWVILTGIIMGAVLISPIVNAIAIFGEEFGWRGYLQPKLLPLGERKMYLIVGVIWGVWHWPIIWMGHNYPGYPMWGSLAMVWFTLVVGTFIGWAALRAKSIWPAVIGHGVLNGVANLPILFLANETNPLTGPLVVGLVGGLFFTIASAIIFWKAES